MIDIANVWHYYSARPVLRGVNLRVVKGERVVVMGPNGMGKSTLLSVVAGILSPLKGHVEIDGERRRRSIKEEKSIRKKVMYLPDAPWLPAHLSPREYVLAMGRLYGVDEARLTDRAELMLDVFGLAGRADNAIAELSTGQQKKTGVCGALATEAPVMILDEPFSGGLDSSALHSLQQVLKNLAEKNGTTLLMAVPVPELVDGLADRIAIIKDGEIISCDTSEAFKQQTKSNTLAEALEAILQPDSAQKLKRFLDGDAR